MKMYLKLTLYHELTIAKAFSTQKARTDAQSIKFKVMPDTRACMLGFVGILVFMSIRISCSVELSMKKVL